MFASSKISQQNLSHGKVCTNQVITAIKLLVQAIGLKSRKLDGNTFKLFINSTEKLKDGFVDSLCLQILTSLVGALMNAALLGQKFRDEIVAADGIQYLSSLLARI